MEAAVRRTTDVHKSQLRQKEMELQEQQRLMQVWGGEGRGDAPLMCTRAS